MKDWGECDKCKHSTTGFDDTLCVAMKDPVSIVDARSDRGQCKPAALMFEPKERKLERWHPY